jgi:DNA-binding XRE family transcriptional regulator
LLLQTFAGNHPWNYRPYCFQIWGVKSKAALTKRFGKRVREMRRLRNLSQEEFAAVAGLDRSYMGAIERGEQNPSLWIIARIADALEVTVADLCQGV